MALPKLRRKMRKALVTGGAGFIGSHVADTFIANGWEVTIVDDLSSGKRENIPEKSKFHEIGVNSPEFSTPREHGKLRCRRPPRRPDRRQKERRRPRRRRQHQHPRHAQPDGSAAEERRRALASIFTSTGGVLYGDFNTPPNFETYPEGSGVAVRNREAEHASTTSRTTRACTTGSTPLSGSATSTVRGRIRTVRPA